MQQYRIMKGGMRVFILGLGGYLSIYFRFEWHPSNYPYIIIRTYNTTTDDQIDTKLNLSLSILLQNIHFHSHDYTMPVHCVLLLVVPKASFLRS